MEDQLCKNVVSYKPKLCKKLLEVVTGGGVTQAMEY
jgi:hypothetical protein